MDWINEVRQQSRELDLSAVALRTFGVTVGPVLVFFAFVAHRKWPSSSAYLVLAGVGLLLILLGLALPKSLRTFYRLWMGLSFAVGGIMSRLILLIIFALLVLPIGLLARLAKKKFLSLDIEREAPTYWVRKSAKKTDYEQIY